MKSKQQSATKLCMLALGLSALSASNAHALDVTRTDCDTDSNHYIITESSQGMAVLDRNNSRSGQPAMVTVQAPYIHGQYKVYRFRLEGERASAAASGEQEKYRIDKTISVKLSNPSDSLYEETTYTQPFSIHATVFGDWHPAPTVTADLNCSNGLYRAL